MLAYAAHRRRATERSPAPHAMLVILVAHIAVIAAVMSAKMDLPQKIFDPPTKVDLIKVPPPPPPPDAQPNPQPQTQPSTIDQVPVIVPVPRPADQPIDTRPLPLPIPSGEIIGPAIDPVPQPLPPAQPVRVGPRFATPASALRPPYPASKIASEEEAVLKLRLAIDERGRITSVSPVGSADPAFLEAARRHLIARWRYKPATEDGRPVASTTVITLRFELEG